MSAKPTAALIGVWPLRTRRPSHDREAGSGTGDRRANFLAGLLRNRKSKSLLFFAEKKEAKKTAIGPWMASDFHHRVVQEYDRRKNP